MGKEAVLTETVRRWAAEQLPGEPRAAERAAAVALDAYRHGKSLPQASRQARDFLGSWSRHPSHRGAGHRIPIAS